MEVSVKRDGLILRGKLERSNGLDSCPIAILFHGYGSDLGYEQDSLFSIIAERLNEAGIAALRFDFSGRGKSDGRSEDMDMFRELIDAIEILKYARSLDFVTEIYLIGHSQGGVIAGMLAAYYEDVVAKLAMLAPAAALKDDAWKGTCMGTEYDTNHIPEVQEIGSRKILTGGHYFRTAKYLPIYEVTANYRKPAITIHGMKDVVVAPGYSVQYHEAMEDCRLYLFDNLDHGIAGEDREAALAVLLSYMKEM